MKTTSTYSHSYAAETSKDISNIDAIRSGYYKRHKAVFATDGKYKEIYAVADKIKSIFDNRDVDLKESTSLEKAFNEKGLDQEVFKKAAEATKGKYKNNVRGEFIREAKLDERELEKRIVAIQQLAEYGAELDSYFKDKLSNAGLISNAGADKTIQDLGAFAKKLSSLSNQDIFDSFGKDEGFTKKFFLSYSDWFGTLWGNIIGEVDRQYALISAINALSEDELNAVLGHGMSTSVTVDGKKTVPYSRIDTEGIQSAYGKQGITDISVKVNGKDGKITGEVLISVKNYGLISLGSTGDITFKHHSFSGDRIRGLINRKKSLENIIAGSLHYFRRGPKSTRLKPDPYYTTLMSKRTNLTASQLLQKIGEILYMLGIYQIFVTDQNVLTKTPLSLFLLNDVMFKIQDVIPMTEADFEAYGRTYTKNKANAILSVKTKTEEGGFGSFGNTNMFMYVNNYLQQKNSLAFSLKAKTNI